MRGKFIFIFFGISLLILLFFIFKTKTIEVKSLFIKKDLLLQQEKNISNNQKISDEKVEIVSFVKPKDIYLDDLDKIRKKFISENKDFLDLNLAKMEIKVYKNGSLIKKASIFRKGDLERWGGTPLGLYQIQSKHKLAYSVIANSYMPWSLHVFGKYYIHGDNYYPGGETDLSPITGGCVRLKNEVARAIFELTEVGMSVLITDKGFENDNYQYSFRNLNKFPRILAESYLVADLDSGFVFTEKDYQKQLPLGSLTQLMTVITVAEKVDLRKSILVTPKMLNSSGTTNGLMAGKTFYVFELFFSILRESSNKAAKVLAYFLGEKETVKLMNEKARAILLENTKFVSSDGLDLDNISTAQDLFYLARYILNVRPMFLEISRHKEIWTFGRPNRFKDLKNKNLFIEDFIEDPNFLGGQTVYLGNKKYNGIFIFRFPLKDNDNSERRIVIILLGGEEPKEKFKNSKNEIQIILDWLKENYF